MKDLQLDENLILRLETGDANAFRDLYNETSGIVYGFALSILRNQHDAEDIMHDAYIRIYTNAGKYKPMGKPLAWMLTIVKNLCSNKAQSDTGCEDIAEYEDFAFEDNSESIIDRDVLAHAMNVLDLEEREIFVLHAMTGLKHREIADILELPLGTVLSKYNRALRKMRKEIEGEC